LLLGKDGDAGPGAVAGHGRDEVVSGGGALEDEDIANPLARWEPGEDVIGNEAIRGGEEAVAAEGVMFDLVSGGGEEGDARIDGGGEAEVRAGGVGVARGAETAEEFGVWGGGHEGKFEIRNQKFEKLERANK
jgi:hypothetical protein